MGAPRSWRTFVDNHADAIASIDMFLVLTMVKKSPRFPGLSADLIVRMILDQCATTAEAVAGLRQLPHAMQYNYSLLDARGDALVVEAGAGWCRPIIRPCSFIPSSRPVS
jgi:predicted choloylglycine hydrolase